MGVVECEEFQELLQFICPELRVPGAIPHRTKLSDMVNSTFERQFQSMLSDIEACFDSSSNFYSLLIIFLMCFSIELPRTCGFYQWCLVPTESSVIYGRNSPLSCPFAGSNWPSTNLTDQASCIPSSSWIAHRCKSGKRIHEDTWRDQLPPQGMCYQ